MSNTVNIEATVVVNIPVTLTVDMTVKTNKTDVTGVSLAYAVYKFSLGLKHSPEGDLENIAILSREPEDLIEAINKRLHEGFKIKDWHVAERQ